MLRNSASRSVSPNLSARPSPPITRSVSRLAQNGYRNTSIDQSTPKMRRNSSNGIHIHTVERHVEVADDDDYEYHEDIQNTSKFVNSHHFTHKERVEMYFADLMNWSEYSWRAIRRRFVPPWRTIVNWIHGFIIISIMANYALDIYNGASREPLAVKLQSRVEQIFEDQNKKIEGLISRLEVLSHDLEDFRKLHGNRDMYSNDVLDKVGNLEQKISTLHNDIENVKTETKLSTELVQTVEIKKQEAPVSIIPRKRNLPGVNVANSLIGATIDEKCSSHAVSAKDSIFYDMMSYVTSLKAGYVLLDRDLLIPGEAWCTYDDRATLTVNLARYITPTAVSYQHVKWSGIVPNHAPKVYSVVACHSPCCTDNTILAANCEYGHTEGNEDDQEQFCDVQQSAKSAPINHVQFRFKENHGNMTKTCAYLVRVYGTPVGIPPEKLVSSTQKTQNNDVKSMISSYLPSIPYFE